MRSASGAARLPGRMPYHATARPTPWRTTLAQARVRGAPWDRAEGMIADYYAAGHALSPHRLPRRQRPLRRPPGSCPKIPAGGDRSARHSLPRLRGTAPGEKFRGLPERGERSLAGDDPASNLRHGHRRAFGALPPVSGRSPGSSPAVPGAHPLGIGAATHAEGDAAGAGPVCPDPALRLGVLSEAFRIQVL